MTTAKTEKAMSTLRTVAGEASSRKEAEGCAGVEDVREAEDAGDDGVGVAEGSVVRRSRCLVRRSMSDDERRR